MSNGIKEGKASVRIQLQGGREDATARKEGRERERYVMQGGGRSGRASAQVAGWKLPLDCQGLAWEGMEKLVTTKKYV